MGDNVLVFNYNYCKITNHKVLPIEDDTKYYFITSKRWISENTIQLNLAMDTLNSFKYDSDYSVNDKTFIERMHRNRFINKTTEEYHFVWTIRTKPANDEQVTENVAYSNVLFANAYVLSWDATLNLEESSVGDAVLYSKTLNRNHNPQQIECVIRYTGEVGISQTFVIDVYATFRYFQKIIDFHSEGISTPLYKKYDNIIYENKGENKADWRLYYKNQDNQETSAVDCFLKPKDNVAIQYNSTGRFIYPQQMMNKWTYFLNSYNTGGQAIITTLKIRLKVGNETYLLQYRNNQFNFIVGRGEEITTPGQPIQYKIHAYLYLGEYRRDLGYFDYFEVLDNLTSIYAYRDEASGTYPKNYTLFYSLGLWQYNIDVLQEFTFASTTHKTLYSNIDKTLSTNIKIIDLPYSPTTINVEDDEFVIGSPWSVDDNSGQSNPEVKLQDMEQPFENLVESNERNIFGEFIQPIENNWDWQTRVLSDPKLLHSDFYRYKFVYDSFAKEFALEMIDENKTYENDNSVYFRFEFIPSRNIVSKFLFKFDNISYKYSVEDFEKILAVARNNEEVLYNSAYINYIRNGFNYDVKSKERNEMMMGLGLVGSAVGFAGTLGTAMATQNPLALVGVGASGVSLFTSLLSYTEKVAQGEENLQRKLQETKAQAVSVLNSDDIDLLYAYSENKAKLVKYTISEHMNEVLNDLFFYCGYKVEEQGKPDINTRTNFNFVKAQLKLDSTQNLTDDIINDIKNKFEEGVTFLHCRNTDVSTFDWNQTKENIERF